MPHRKRKIINVGFISTRIAGTDGVSLEITKWADVLERNQYNCFYFAGKLDRPADKSFFVEEAFFEHPEILKINEYSFGRHTRPREISELVQGLKDYLKQKIYEFVRTFDIHLIIPENALAIPMNIPLGLALTEFIAETGIPTIAHHHDFYWERNRFLVNGVMDYIDRSFPPFLPSISHVVINSIASEQLSHRKGISNTIIPNVLDYAHPPKIKTEHCQQLRKLIGLDEEDLFILQPTRIVPRKWIERAVEIVYLMKLPNPRLVISHASGDEGDTYFKRVMEYAEHLGVEIIAIDHLIGPERSYGKQPLFTIGDVYSCADLVTYPSGYEGFGNAFLEAIYYQKPIVVNRYSIYVVDIEPKGFDVITIDGFVTQDTIDQIWAVLNDSQRRQQMVDTNYQKALKYFSYEVLERRLMYLVQEFEKDHGAL